MYSRPQSLFVFLWRPTFWSLKTCPYTFIYTEGSRHTPPDNERQTKWPRPLRSGQRPRKNTCTCTRTKVSRESGGKGGRHPWPPGESRVERRIDTLSTANTEWTGPQPIGSGVTVQKWALNCPSRTWSRKEPVEPCTSSTSRGPMGVKDLVASVTLEPLFVGVHRGGDL